MRQREYLTKAISTDAPKTAHFRYYLPRLCFEGRTNFQLVKALTDGLSLKCIGTSMAVTLRMSHMHSCIISKHVPDTFRNCFEHLSVSHHAAHHNILS